MPRGSKDKTDAGGSAAWRGGIDPSLNDEFSLAKDKPYSFLLNGCHTKAANGSGQLEGGVRNISASTLAWVFI
jgi:hypothetical protein